MVTALTFYFLGLLTGAAGVVAAIMYIGSRPVKNKSGKPAEPKKVTRSEIEKRMKRVKDLTNEQLDLIGQLDQPQKNGLDGKYKNSLNSAIKEIEQEKSDLLKSILADGHDPKITTMDPAGVVTEMFLSDFMAEMVLVAPKPSVPTPPSKSSVVGKFTVHKGGKDDGSGTTH
jgi:hypothetical protein